MVKIRELEDDYETDPEYITDNDETESQYDNDEYDIDDEYDDIDTANESLVDRIIALQDAIPYSTRTKLQSFVGTTSSVLSNIMYYSGQLAWVVSTAALLVVFPLALEADKEQVMVQYEKEQEMLQQQQQQLQQQQQGQQ